MELSTNQLKGLIEIFTELETEKILDKSVNKVSEILDAKGCSIFLYNESRNCIDLAKTTDDLPPDTDTISYKKGEGLTGWVFKYKRPLLIQNLHEQTNESLKQTYGNDLYWASKFVEGKTKKAKSYIAVPMISQNNKFFGVIRSSSSNINYSEKDLGVLQNIAGYISIALENSYHYLQEHKKADYFKMLTELGTKLHSHYQLEDLLVFIAEQAAITFSAETSEIYLRDRENPNNLILRAGYGIPTSLINVASHEVGEGLTGTLVKEKHSIRLKNVLTFKNYKGKYRSAMKKNLKYGDRLAFLGIPIMVRSEAIGCIKLYNKIPKYTGGLSFFDEDDEKYLDILGFMLSVAIENLKYLESMQSSAVQMIKTQRLTALGTIAIRLPNEITNALTTAHLSVKNIIRRIMKKRKVDNIENLFRKMKLIDDHLKEVADGVKILQEFSTKAGFIKITKSWSELVDEALLFLSDELIHKKITIHRDKIAEMHLPKLYVEPNEIIEVLINLLFIALIPMRHYDSDLVIHTEYEEEKNVLHTKIHSIDNLSAPILDGRNTDHAHEPKLVSPQKFMLNISEEIITVNYQGKLDVEEEQHGTLIKIEIPVGGDHVS
jgi:signal transduction protein with GAF and PtsI domain